MEGGIFPWKLQKLGNQHLVDLDSYGKPLPPPPAGFLWEKNEDGSWALKNVYVLEDLTVGGQTTFVKPTIVEHVVLSTDTLQGICLKYRVSSVELRRMNNFSGSSIQFTKALKIPIEHNFPITIQEDSHEVSLQRFKNMTGESTAEAKIYLQENNYDLEKSLEAWSGDESWEAGRRERVQRYEATKALQSTIFQRCRNGYNASIHGPPREECSTVDQTSNQEHSQSVQLLSPSRIVPPLAVNPVTIVAPAAVLVHRLGHTTRLAGTNNNDDGTLRQRGSSLPPPMSMTFDDDDEDHHHDIHDKGSTISQQNSTGSIWRSSVTTGAAASSTSDRGSGNSSPAANSSGKSSEKSSVNSSNRARATSEEVEVSSSEKSKSGRFSRHITRKAAELTAYFSFSRSPKSNKNSAGTLPAVLGAECSGLNFEPTVMEPLLREESGSEQ